MIFGSRDIIIPIQPMTLCSSSRISNQPFLNTAVSIVWCAIFPRTISLKAASAPACGRMYTQNLQAVEIGSLQLKDFVYYPADAEEHFINYSTPEDSLAGYLRLSLPKTGPLKDRNDASIALYDLIPELKEAALIREVHIYGQSLEVGADLAGAAQHSGLGTSLLEKSEEIAKQAGFKNLAVIAAVGTRQYYEKRGFKRARLYMTKEIL
jgi:histone acetyltransferase (RNA polymerase elongator complex component)